MTCLLAIDQGTSGTKAIVVDYGADGPGRVVSVAEVALRPQYLGDGAVEQDPEALWDSVVSAGREALAQAGLRSRASRWPTRARRCWRGTARPAVR